MQLVKHPRKRKPKGSFEGSFNLCWRVFQKVSELFSSCFHLFIYSHIYILTCLYPTDLLLMLLFFRMGHSSIFHILHSQAPVLTAPMPFIFAIPLILWVRLSRSNENMMYIANLNWLLHRVGKPRDTVRGRRVQSTRQIESQTTPGSPDACTYLHAYLWCIAAQLTLNHAFN